jgi:DnaJ-class molecular chaperone
MFGNKNPFESIPDDRGKKEKPKCPMCKGKGSIIEGNKKKNCPKCKGLGVLDT